MTARITAVYQGGVLKPSEPLSLSDGDIVELTIKPTQGSSNVEREESVAKIRQAATVMEWIAAANAAPPDVPEGYDLCEALNENRRQQGEPLAYDPKLKGINW
jgi:predicted DNA-binding antitoxin AbrB/MazE fold protein